MKNKKNNKGQSLVEMAFILPIVIILTFGIVDFGFMLSKQHTLNNMTRELARAASIGKSESDLNTMATSLAEQIGDVTITYTPELNQRKKGDAITCTVDYTYKPITPVIDVFGPFHLNSTSQTLVENIP